MADNPSWEICERIAEVQALLAWPAANTRPQTWSRRRRLSCRSPSCAAMFDVGYFPPNTPPAN
jgi:hypothetical protein